MITETRRLEFWNFLIAEKNQPRPKGITTQRLAVIRPAILSLDEVWLKVVDQNAGSDRSAADFYGSNEPAAITSRTEFWAAVRSVVRLDENKTNAQNQSSNPGGQSRRKWGSRNKRR